MGEEPIRQHSSDLSVPVTSAFTVGLFVLFSLVAHGLIAWGLAVIPIESLAGLREVPEVEIEISPAPEVELDATELPPEPEAWEDDEFLDPIARLPDEQAAPPDAPAPTEAGAVAGTMELGPVDPGGGEPGEVDPGAEPGPEGTPEDELAARAAERERMRALLDPSAVARGGFDFGAGGGPSQPGAPAGRGTGRRRPTGAEIGAALGAGLRDEAMARPHIQRTRPELRRQPDGSFAYEGHRFQARIRPDGRVDFDDRPGVQTEGFSASGSFDLTDAIMGSAGQDPHRAEREWFMRHTEELRHRLEAEHRTQEMQRGLRRLRGRLARVWATESRTHRARRFRLFSIWDDIDDGESGAAARRVVIEFIQEVLPQGSEHAFTESEIASLNGRRESRATFAPY